MTFAQTKIQRPRPRAGLMLARPALERELVAALSAQRVVLVCAPAGYGKTALLARALEQLPAGHAAAWVALDPGDDLHRLLECLLAALEAFDPPWRTAPEGLMATAVHGGDAARGPVVDELVNTLEACEIAHGVIVLDDLHHVDDPACLAFLERLLQRLGARWTVAIAARHEPALRLARLRAGGELADLGPEALRFTLEEARELLARAGIDARAADALHERTAGWPAGLRLALNGAPGAGGAIDRAAFAFLASEVVARTAPQLREFLLLTSVLHELDEPRCAALTGDPFAAARLEEIERLGLFATVVDDARRTLRLHDLFRDALQHMLRLERRDVWLAQLRR
ncbi:MAG TPA: AAA family ATPase, partial [Albitalea sp.]